MAGGVFFVVRHSFFVRDCAGRAGRPPACCFYAAQGFGLEAFRLTSVSGTESGDFTGRLEIYGEIDRRKRRTA
jgi:hypothetical protein